MNGKEGQVDAKIADDFPIWERLFQALKMRDEQVFRMYQSDFNYMATIGGLLISMRGQGAPKSMFESAWHKVIDEQLELVAHNQKRILEQDD